MSLSKVFGLVLIFLSGCGQTLRSNPAAPELITQDQAASQLPDKVAERPAARIESAAVPATPDNQAPTNRFPSSESAQAEAEEVLAQKPEPPVLNGKSIEYDGSKWTFVEEVRPSANSDVTRLGMHHLVFTDDDPSRRLLVVLRGDDEQAANEQVFDQIYQCQSLDGQRWVSDGLRMEIMQNGGLAQRKYVFGEVFGVAREWYGNGQLRFEDNYNRSRKDGRCRTWHENGRLQVEAEYVLGNEIRGKGWDADGTPWRSNKD